MGNLFKAPSVPKAPPPPRLLKPVDSSKTEQERAELEAARTGRQDFIINLMIPKGSQGTGINLFGQDKGLRQ